MFNLRLIGKLLGDFLLVVIELSFARCLRFVIIHAFDRQTDRRTDRQTDVDSNTVRMLRSRTVKSKSIELLHDKSTFIRQTVTLCF